MHMNQRQRAGLRAVMDTFVAALDDDESLTLIQSNPAATLDEILAKEGQIMTAISSATTDPMAHVVAFLTHAIPPALQRIVLQKLTTLNGSMFRRPFTEMIRAEREQELLKWQHSAPLAYKALCWASLYPIYGHALAHPTQTVFAAVDPIPMLSTYKAQVLQAITFDVIVVGSGPAGSVIAAQVASAGGSVLVIEKGKNPTQQYMHDMDALSQLYDAQGLQCNKSGSVSLLAPSALGGGACVDWSISLQPPPSVLDDWAKKSHDQFNVAEFKQDLATVSDHIGVSTEGLEHNFPNTVLKEGCAKLGLPAIECPTNTRGFPYDTRSCFGNTHQRNQTPHTNIWLRDAEAYGVHFMDNTKVTRIITRNGQAIGVECLSQATIPCTYTAKIVVAAAGSLHTPTLLRRSGLKNKHIGRHLKLHPTSFVHGYYPNHTSDMEGPVASVVTPGIHVAAVPPALAATLLPWRGALAHKQTMAKVSQMVPLAISIPDSEHEQAAVLDDVVYTLTKNDETTLVQGIIRACRILAITGATEVYISQLAIEPFRFDPSLFPGGGVDAVKDGAFIKWLDKVRAHGLKDGVFSMHQMGTCRMGRNAQTSVAKTTGESWEIDNLYIGDGSLFMTATGVDPMLTVEALAYGVSRHIISRLGKNAW